MIGKNLLDILPAQSSVRPPALPGKRQNKGDMATENAADPAIDRLELAPPGSRDGAQALAFQFRHMAIRREIAALRSTGGNPGSEPPKPLEADSAAISGIREERRTELDLFYARTQTIALGLDSQTADHLQSTSQGVGRVFEVTISLEASFLHQFTGQSESLASSDPALFDQYLTATDGMLSLSGEAAKGFFDMVDQALRDAQTEVMSGLEGMLSDLGATLGLEGDALQNFKSQIARQVAGFFTDLSQFVSQAHQRIGEAPPAPNPPLPATAPTSSAIPENPGVTAV